MENECEALPGVAYPGVRDNRTTVDTKTGYMMKRIRPESRFLPTPLAFDAPVRGIPIGISPSRSQKKLEWLGYSMVKKFRRYLYSLSRNSRT